MTPLYLLHCLFTTLLVVIRIFPVTMSSDPLMSCLGAILGSLLSSVLHADSWLTDWLLVKVKVSQSQSHIATDGHSVSKSWRRAPSDIYYCLAVTVLFLWGSLSDERTGLSFVYAAGPCQRSHSRVQVPWDSRPYFTLSDFGLPFSSPPTTRRVTVEVFDPASTWVSMYVYMNGWMYGCVWVYTYIWRDFPSN
jgi:hypothetical protein